MSKPDPYNTDEYIHGVPRLLWQSLHGREPGETPLRMLFRQAGLTPPMPLPPSPQSEPPPPQKYDSVTLSLALDGKPRDYLPILFHVKMKLKDQTKINAFFEKAVKASSNFKELEAIVIKEFGAIT